MDGIQYCKIDSEFEFNGEDSYENIAYYVTRYIQEYLVNVLNLVEKYIPLTIDNDGNPGKNNILFSSIDIINIRGSIYKQKKLFNSHTESRNGPSWVICLINVVCGHDFAALTKNLV